jgi:serine protease AprX
MLSRANELKSERSPTARRRRAPSLFDKESHTPMRKRILAVAVLLMVPGPAFGQLLGLNSGGLTQTVQQTTSSLLGGVTGKVAPDLQGLDPNSSVDVIVQFNQLPTVSMLEQITLLGGVVKSTFTVVNAVWCTLPVPVIQLVAALPFVTYISPDRTVGMLLDNSAGAVNATAAWNAGWDGAGVGIAIIDSGITPVHDLQSPSGTSRIVYSEDFAGGGTNDLYGHGTHVAGIAAGDAADSTCPICTRHLRGMAPRANLINLRVLDGNGQGKDSSVLMALDTVLLLRNRYNIRVVNLSLGRGIYETYRLDPLCQAVEFLWREGITVVVAAGNGGRDNSYGNNGYGTIDAPGNDPYVITVGAMKTMGTPNRSDDLIASYSSKGPTAIDHIVKPDLVAPGNLVVSLLAPNATLAAEFPQTLIPLSYYERTPSPYKSNVYYQLSGTSMATPVVSGAVADLLEAEPYLTPDQVKAKLMLTAYKNFPPSSTAVDPTTGQVFVDYYDIFTVGAGYLDIQAALADDNTAAGSAMSPTAQSNPTTGNAYLLFDPSAVWNTSPTWDMRSVWGTGQFVNGTSSLWGTRSVWGTSNTEGYSSVWGTRSVWGTNANTPDQAASISANGEN